MELAVIIPAYKEKYFEEALGSLATQTNKNFTVYIGDDCSPHDLKSICKNFEGLLNIRYTRFKNNVGGKNIVEQWKRCVDLSKEEKWIWLFSDDDIADSNCVESFYNTLEKKNDRFDVYRFNVTIINNNGEVLRHTPIGPEEETSEEMAYNLLLGKRGNSMPDHIFSRRVYLESGGFVYTDFAQGADWATSMLFSKAKGICIIPNAQLLWRYSGDNISSTAFSNKSKTIKGHLQFLEWVTKHFTYLKNSPSSVSYDMMIEAAKFNFREILISHYKGFSTYRIISLAHYMHKVLQYSYLEAFKTLLFIKRITYPTSGLIYRTAKRIKNILSPTKNFTLHL